MAKIKTNRARGGSSAPASLPIPSASKSTTALSTLEEIVTGKQSPVDIKNFAYLFMERIGGQQGFVDLVIQEYNGSPVGSLARARTLEIMMKLFALATPKENFGDYTDYTDDDLKNVVSKHLAATPAELQWINHVCI